MIEHGLRRSESGEVVDVCIVNTCSVTDVADQKGRQLIRRLHRENPNAVIIVTGCYAQLKPQEVAGLEGVNYVVGANDKERIIDIIEDFSSESEQRRLLSHQPADITHTTQYVTDLATAEGRKSSEGSAFYPSRSWDDRTRCFLKVQDGCDYYCTYCTIPMARGRSRNASVQNTAEEALNAIHEGAKEIILTGVNIGDFGRSTNESLIELLQALDQLPTNRQYRIRISSCEPNLLTNQIIDFVSDSLHFAPHFHIPLQSGSDDVLRIMHRRYDTSLFAERVKHIKQRMPHAFIGVDCMVGVMGEKQQMFADYVRFVSDLPISQLHVFPYSERANTKMLTMGLERVKKTEQKRRVETLLQISKSKLEQFYMAEKGREAIVLWEGKKEQQPDGSIHMSGWTENYVRVTAPYEKDKINTFCKITI